MDDDSAEDPQRIQSDCDFDATDEPFSLCPGALAISSDVKSLIWSTRPGERKDLQFIKDLTLAALGPEIVASCSIKGTAKGGVKGKDKVKKNPLDANVLTAIRDKLVSRVAKEKQLSVEKVKADDDPRISTFKLHSAIRDLQKKLRNAGYGSGGKSNTVTTVLFDRATKQD